MIQRGQIYWTRLDPTIGSESKKTRPALIVSNDASNQAGAMVTVLPITSNVKTIRPFEVLLAAGVGGLKVDSKVKVNQIRTVDKRRLCGEPLGPTVPSDALDQVARAIKIHLDISS